jgi:L,D-peptidoglycan transpeptidase YkuD (ErfK/YbiS/YcfS/YnhG family)
MKRKDVLYKLGLVVDYNQRPVVAGAGSAIFIHIWRNENKGTAGCAALAESNLVQLVQSLKRELNPSVLFLP